MTETAVPGVRIKVVGVGGAGGNAVSRMAGRKDLGLELLAINTDTQALGRIDDFPSFAIGPATTNGTGSGGDPSIGRKAMRESQAQVSQLLEGADMVFITAGMGGGTGTGAAPIVAETARKLGALTVGVVTRPFSFEGLRRKEVSDVGLRTLEQKVDTLITIENDRLLTALDGAMTLDRAFRTADDVLRQGVEGISEIITVPGLINVDFADVKAVMAGGGRSFMAMGEGKGKSAAQDAVKATLSGPLFDVPLQGCTGILLNIRGGKELTLGQVHEMAEIVLGASQSQAQVVFGVVNDDRWKRRVRITLVATGVGSADLTGAPQRAEPGHDARNGRHPERVEAVAMTNGQVHEAAGATLKLL